MTEAATAPGTGGSSLTTKIMIGMAAGVILGVIFNRIGSDFINTHIVGGLFWMIGTMFVNALKMLVVPLVFFSLLTGVAGIGDVRVLGRVGSKSFGLYLLTTAVAIAVAIAIAVLVGPGVGFDMTGVTAAGIEAQEAPTVWQVFAGIVPTNPVAAFASGEMLQVIFYTIVLGIAVLMMGDRSQPFVAACEYMNEVMMKIVSIVMYFAPYGVFCLIAKTFAEQGIELFGPVLAYVLTLVAALFLHLFGTLSLFLKVLSGLNPVTFMKKMRPAQIFAFSTASSNATIPVTLRTVTERVGVDNSVASFTVPFGATINMDGTAIMQGVATVFLANVYGIDLGLGGYLTVIGMAVLASIGTAGVPGVGLVMLTMVLTQVGLPIEGIALILGVDRLMDMIRTAVNITGDAVVTTIVAKGEGKLDLAVFNDPYAGMLAEDDLQIDPPPKVASRRPRITPRRNEPPEGAGSAGPFVDDDVARPAARAEHLDPDRPRPPGRDPLADIFVARRHHAGPADDGASLGRAEPGIAAIAGVMESEPVPVRPVLLDDRAGVAQHHAMRVPHVGWCDDAVVVAEIFLRGRRPADQRRDQRSHSNSHHLRVLPPANNERRLARPGADFARLGVGHRGETPFTVRYSE